MGRHRRSNLVVAVILVMALIVGGFLWLRRGGGPSGVAVRPNSVALFDPRASRVVSDAVAGSSPGPLAVESGSLWVGNQGDHTLTRIDLRSLRALRTFGLSYPPAAMAAGDGYVWIVDGFTGTVSRLIAAYDQLSAPNFPGPVVEGLVAVAASGGDLWMGLSNRQLLEVDPSSLQVRATVRGAGHVQAIAFSGNDIWTIQFDDSDLRRVSRRAGAVADSLPLPPHPIAIAADSKSIWVATSQDDRLWQIDAASARVVRSIPLGVSPSAVADGAGGVWVVAGQAGILERVDPATGDLVRTVHVGRPVGGIVVTAAGVWLSAD